MQNSFKNQSYKFVKREDSVLKIIIDYMDEQCNCIMCKIYDCYFLF